jgi:glycine cleavage system aminomethyltransferase T
VLAGADLGLTRFGSRALNSLRLEKSFGNWAREFRPIYSPVEAGLERFVNLGKGDFIGRDGYLRDKQSGGVRRLVTFVVDAAEADAIGDEPVWHDGKVVGWITSGGYGHCVGKSIALGYVPVALANADSGFEVELLGERRPAALARGALYDPGRNAHARVAGATGKQIGAERLIEDVGCRMVGSDTHLAEWSIAGGWVKRSDIHRGDHASQWPRNRIL